MTTGAVNATVTGTVYTDNKLAIYQVDKVLLPLDIVLPSKAPAPAPTAAKGGSAKSDKTKSSSGDDSDGGDNKELPAEASGGCMMRFKGEGTMWVHVVIGVAMMILI